MRSQTTMPEAEEDPTSQPHSTSGPSRFAEIDFLKASGIVAVILIHSLRAPWDPGISSTELWLGTVTRFAVPGFLLCSGFLYATEKPITLRTVGRRLRRVLIPYLICSFGAQIWWVTRGQGHAFDEIVQDFLFGSSFGPFYYVFVHFFLVLFAPLFVLLPRFAIGSLTALLILSQGWFESRTSLSLPIFWQLRSPLLWWGYFMLGWLIRLHHDTVRQWITSRRSALMAILALAILACTGIANMENRTEWVRAAIWLDIYAILAFILVATIDRRSVPTLVGAISNASFAIYLLHLFFIYAAELLVRPPLREFDIFVVAGYWSAGLFGAFAVIVTLRALLGQRSRDIIGA